MERGIVTSSWTRRIDPLAFPWQGDIVKNTTPRERAIRLFVFASSTLVEVSHSRFPDHNLWQLSVRQLPAISYTSGMFFTRTLFRGIEFEKIARMRALIERESVCNLGKRQPDSVPLRVELQQFGRFHLCSEADDNLQRTAMQEVSTRRKALTADPSRACSDRKVPLQD